MTLNPQIKLVLDLLPLAVFFIGFKWLGLFAATAVLVAVTLAILAITYYVERRVALSPLITAIMVTLFGGLTLWLHDERFIKVKPTLIYLTFATLLLVGCLFKKSLLKPLLSDAMHLNDRAWRILALRWGLFFITLAGLNEYVWRHFSTADWVNFKVFGCMGLTFVFVLAQTPFIQRNSLPMLEKEKPEGKKTLAKNSD